MAIVAAFSAPDVEPGTDIVMLGERELAEQSPFAPTVYAEIPGFKFNYNSHPAKVESKGECERICTAQPTCKSYSYASKSRQCEWSTSKMQYDPDFVFNFKPPSGGKYHEFPGLVYRATGWLKSEGKTYSECADLCDEAAACAAFSYRARDKLCLLSGHTIGFHEDFNYYEKEGEHKEFAMRPADMKKPAPAAKKPQPVEPNASPQAVVNAAIQAAKAVAAKAAPAPAQLVNAEPESVVAQRLQAVKDWAAAKIKQEDEETQLKIKAHEVDNKAVVDKEKAQMEAQEANDKIASDKARAQREAGRAATAAQEKADDMVQKVRLEAKQASVSAELAQAAAEKRQAAAATEKAKKQVANIKEIDDKKAEVAKKELDEKQAAKTSEDMQLKLIREKDTKTNKITTRTAVAEQVAAVRKEMAGKSKAALEETAERQNKMTDEERARKSTRTVEMKGKKDKIERVEDKKKAMQEQLAAAQKQTADAVVNEGKSKAEMKIELVKEKSEDEAKMAANELEAKETATAAVQKAEMAKERADEQLRKKARVETDMAAASKEAVNKQTDDTCAKELKQMQQDAVTAEQQVAAEGSKMTAAAGEALLVNKKKEWKDKLDAKEQECTPKSVDFTVEVKPLASASIQAPAPEGPDEEFVELIQEEPTEMSAWPLDRPPRGSEADGSPKPAEPYPDDATRLRESNAAQARGFQPLEIGAREQVAFYKFKVAELRTGEVVKSCSLNMRKEGGPASSCVVKLTSCDYDPQQLTYDTRPQVVNTVSDGGVFPEADGDVTIPLDTSLITNFLANAGKAEHTVCVEVTGGLEKTPVMIHQVQLKMNIRKDPGVVDTSPRRRRSTADIQVDRRRRTALDESRRRRSVQAVKDKGVEIYQKELEKWKPRMEQEVQTKVPAAVAQRKVEVEAELRADSKTVIKQAIKAKLESEFSVDAEKAKEAELNTEKIKTALEKTFPPKFAEEKLKLEEKMKKELAETMTKAEDRVIVAEATTAADETVKSDAQALLDGAIAKKVNKDIPAALTAEVEKNAPKDYTQAIDTVVVKSVEEKTKETVDKAVEDAVDRELKLKEGSVGTAAATAAVTERMKSLATQKVADQVQTEKSNNTPLGKKLNRGGAQEREAMAVIENNVASEPSLLSADEQEEIEKTSSQAAVEKLKTKIQSEVPAKIKTKAFVDNVIAELKKSETARLTPIVKADILKNLQTELEPQVRKDVKKKATADIMAEKDSVLKTLHAALVQKNKADLLPKMNAKLSKTVPEALASAKFAAEVEAAQAQLGEKLREDMDKTLRKPFETVSKAKIKAEEKDRRERIEMEVKAQKDAELQRTINRDTATSVLQPSEEQRMNAKMKIDLKNKAEEETKKRVKRELEPTLKEVIRKKYEKGTLKEARAYVKAHREKVIRGEEEAKMQSTIKQNVQSKLVNAKSKLREDIVKRLTKSLFQKAQQDYADQLKQDTEGMTAANKAAVELAKNKELQAQAAKAAETQAAVEMEGSAADQLKSQLEEEEKAAAREQIDKKVKAKLEKEAEANSNEALEQKIKDDIDAMDYGKAHVSQLKGKDKEHDGPNVVNAAGIVNQLSGSTAALLENKANRANETMNGMSAAEITKKQQEAQEQADVKKLLGNSTNATNATQPSNSTVAEPKANATATDTNSTSTNTTGAPDESGEKEEKEEAPKEEAPGSAELSDLVHVFEDKLGA